MFQFIALKHNSIKFNNNFQQNSLIFNEWRYFFRQ